MKRCCIVFHGGGGGFEVLGDILLDREQEQKPKVSL